MDYINIALLEEKRAELGYSQIQVANFMGYESHTAYHTKIKGKRDFSIIDIIKLCQLYQLELTDIIIM